MTLLSAHSLSKSYGTDPLFEEISFTLADGDRIGLVGPNGAGKSTLLKILAGHETADSGKLSKRQGLRIGYASQAPEFPDKSLEEVLTQGDPELLTEARILLGKAQFPDFSKSAASLSGGWKKRLDILLALMQEPDLLLLDEPTNHLDLEGILWLEKFLSRENFSFLVVSHDRCFLDNTCNKIIELNRAYPQGVFISKGNMELYNKNKEAFLENQLEQERSLRAIVKDEVEWLRRSPKARTSKSVARIQKAEELMEELSHLKQRNKQTRAGIGFASSDRETRQLIVAKNLTKTPLFKGLDLVLSPGTRLGILGKNGTGKTTLLKILAGQIPQDAGTIKIADNLKLVYFDQHREQLPLNLSLKEALCPNGEFVTYQGRAIHINGWAKRFLFPPERLPLPIRVLSGGERARILIAKLMLQPADVLFLDEPTNDLDIPTLEIFEESLKEFAGAVVLITHDRYLMEQICTQTITLGLEEKEEPAIQKEKPVVKKVKKLSYIEQKELDGMEAAISKAETELEEATKERLYEKMGTAQKKLDALYERWQHLTDK